VQKLNRFKYINLKVLETYAQRWPQVPIGLSDHTHGSLTVLGAVGLFNCCAVEKHFTLDNTQEGQDHAFSMTPSSWKKMVEETEELQKKLKAARVQTFADRLKIIRAAVDDPEALDLAIGTGVKQLEENEKGTVIVQRRAIRARGDLPINHIIKKEDLIVLRPCPAGALPPYREAELINRKINRPIPQGDCVRLEDLI
jgi:N-acetylneuraminate synthase